MTIATTARDDGKAIKRRNARAECHKVFDEKAVLARYFKSLPGCRRMSMDWLPALPSFLSVPHFLLVR